MSRKSHLKCLFLFGCTLVWPLYAMDEDPVRKMGVMAGPERVFMRPIAEIIPELKGATPTRANGRVGNQLVFWEYRLSSGKTMQLFACTELNGVDCQTRIPQICASGKGSLLNAVMEPGAVTQRRCDGVAQARVGDLHPGCIDGEISNNLQVGLVSCPGN